MDLRNGLLLRAGCMFRSIPLLVRCERPATGGIFQFGRWRTHGRSAAIPGSTLFDIRASLCDRAADV